ncbi:hypothetical protein [Pelagibacterium lentulum]|uniref:DUF2269 family protein n=1 Tax=Pelagibacterium lentulum TaxID=2029865 RepID=A0A916RDI1_9HYPH|nr:hypothetical protein [Pelagibacterium lentulum]GGA47181.1 hypothetical protein GCM10011499_16190 [Pelagibacterium lentulum]
MDLLFKILLFIHFIGLVLGMGSGIALANVGRLSAKAPAPEAGLSQMGEILRRNSHIGLGLLWITGLLLIWLRYGGFGALDVWFWIKIAGVIVLSAAVGMASANYRRIKAGQAGARERGKMLSTIAGVSGIVVVFSAVMAFN